MTPNGLRCSFAINKYVKVADFLMQAGPVEREGAHAVLMQGLADAEKLRLSGSIKNKIEAVVLKLLCMLNTLFGRYGYKPVSACFSALRTEHALPLHRQLRVELHRLRSGC